MFSGPRKRKVVIASGNASLRGKIASVLGPVRWESIEASGGAEALERVQGDLPDALLLDEQLPDLDCDSLARHIQRCFPTLEIIMIGSAQITPPSVRTSRTNELIHAIRGAVTDLESGAREEDLSRPREAGRLRQAVCEVKPLPRENAATHAPLLDSDLIGSEEVVEPISGMVGEGRAMRELIRMIRLVASEDIRVLIEGETGTGKELVAKAVHTLSNRASKAFVVLNCAAIPEALLESELFGHTRGAFTGAVQTRAGRIEEAHGGTLFLDEIGEMPIALQAKLLRFLENGELQRIGANQNTIVNVRVVAATHRLLEQRVAEGTFRADLFYRLSVFPLYVPSLRERKEDIPLLARHLLSQVRGARTPKALTSSALACLHEHDWPGNVRELGHVLHRAMVLSGPKPEIDADHIRVRRVSDNARQKPN